MTARGEVFDIPANQGVVRNITRTPGANDRGAQISPDGKYIAYISDKTGETEVWLQEQQGGEPVQLTKNNDTYIRALAWAPDSKTILYTDRKNRLVEVNVAAKSKRTVLTCPESEFRQVQFSPDSQWITYTRPEKNDMSVVYVYNLKTNKEYPVTEKWYSSSSPVFSTDGKYLIFNSNRDLSPIYSRVEWDYAYTNMGGIYLATLSKDTPSPLLPKDDQISTDNDSKPAGPQGGRAGEGEAKKAVDVKIDADGLFSRIVKLPVRGGEGYMSYFFSDGKKLWYQSGRSIMAFDFEKQEDNKVADGRISAYTAGGKKAIISDRNKLYVVDFPSEHIKLDKPVQMDNMVAVVDYAEEWPQIFDEVWRAFRDGFYLENMHGVDWKAIKKKYAELLPYVKTRLDLNYVIGEMISELACGHAYVSAGEKPEAERIKMGLLGAELSRDKSGFFKVTKILEGAPYREELRSPLTEPGINVKVGDFITAIDGVPTNSVSNIYELLIGKADVLTELSVNGSASAAGAHKVVI